MGSAAPPSFRKVLPVSVWILGRALPQESGIRQLRKHHEHPQGHGAGTPHAPGGSGSHGRPELSTEAKGENLVGLTPCGGESEKKRRQGEGGWKWFAMQICLAPTGSSPYKRKKRWVTFPRSAQAVREPPSRRGPRLGPAPESPGGLLKDLPAGNIPGGTELGGERALPPRWMISR